MTFVGKIFVMLIFVMSLVFMSFAVVVYATHKNWYAVVENPATANPPGLKSQIEKLKGELEVAKSNRAKIEAEVADEKSARMREVSKLTSQVEETRQQRDEYQKQQAALTESTKDAVAAMTAAQNTLAKLREEIADLRTINETVRKERDEKLAESVKLEDQLAQAKAESDRLNKRNVELAKDFARYSQLIQDYDVPLEASPPRLEGVVLAVNANGLMELSIGSDDGLAVGNSLEVFRLGSTAATNKYLGRATVVKVEADRSVARIVPQTKQGNVQVDDRVATRIEQVKQANLGTDNK
ncbi:MAG: hypothetical protein AB7O62_21570 [Pirellulales bacterium]